jgi:hypothetical protein
LLAGANIVVRDTNGDGRADLVLSLDAHNYGLAWFERLPRRKGEISLTQMHSLAVADVDHDGRPAIVTGKRIWAHAPGMDAESDTPPALYVFHQRRSGGQVRFVPELLGDSGTGLQVIAEPIVAGDNMDIVLSNKRGLYLYRRAARVPAPK